MALWLAILGLAASSVGELRSCIWLTERLYGCEKGQLICSRIVNQAEVSLFSSFLSRDGGVVDGGADDDGYVGVADGAVWSDKPTRLSK